MTSDKQDSDVVSESQGSILTLVALLFALKVSLFGAAYSELQANLKVLRAGLFCEQNFDIPELQFYQKKVLPLIGYIDVAMYFVSSVMLIFTIGIIVIAYKGRGSDPILRLVRRLLPAMMVYGTLFIFATLNSVASSYMSGSIDGFIDGAAQFEGALEKQRELLCGENVQEGVPKKR